MATAAETVEKRVGSGPVLLQNGENTEREDHGRPRGAAASCGGPVFPDLRLPHEVTGFCGSLVSSDRSCVTFDHRKEEFTSRKKQCSGKTIQTRVEDEGG